MKCFKVYILCLWIINFSINSVAYAVTSCTKNNTVQVAVTADFSSTFISLSRQFMQETHYCVKQSVASTGILYTEITHGAPFDIFLAADTKRPKLLVQQGLASQQYLRTYAIGHLVLFAPQQRPFLVDKVLHSKNLRLAISNPTLAPYGQATKETLIYLRLWPQLQNHLLMANDVNQALMYVMQGGADAGFISLAQIKQMQEKNKSDHDLNNYWLVPEKLHQPIAQQAVLLKTAEKNPAALAFFHYLQTVSATSIIHTAGYTSI